MHWCPISQQAKPVLNFLHRPVLSSNLYRIASLDARNDLIAVGGARNCFQIIYACAGFEGEVVTHCLGTRDDAEAATHLKTVTSEANGIVNHLSIVESASGCALNLFNIC